MRTIFQAIKTGIFNGIAGSITLLILWKVGDILDRRSREQEVSEIEANAQEFFSNFRNFVTSLGRLL